MEGKGVGLGSRLKEKKGEGVIKKWVRGREVRLRRKGEEGRILKEKGGGNFKREGREEY